MNETLKNIFSRYSCRAFKDEMPPDDILNQITDAALAAPSGMNAMPWHVTLVKNKGIIDGFERDAMEVLKANPDKSIYDRIASRGGKIYYNAPAMVMISIRDGGELDCGILCQNVVLAAEALGLGSLICGMAAFPFSGEKGGEYVKKFAFPDGYKFGVAVLLGYPDAVKEPHEPDRSKLSVVQ